MANEVAALPEAQRHGGHDFANLLLNFEVLPEVPKTRTFMKVSGYPHYENASTNLLAFYFDPEEEHGLATCCLLDSFPFP